MYKRTIGFYAVLLLAFCGIVIQLYQLTNRGFEQAAAEQATVTVTAATDRGTIYDCKFRPLVNQGAMENVACIAAYPGTLARLSEQLDKPTLADITQRLTGGKPIVQKLSGILSPTPGVTQFSVPVREPSTLLAPHIVGYMDSDGIHGKTGIELIYDDYLNQQSGSASVTYTVDATGHPFPDIDPTVTNALDNAKAGVVLTLDSDIQGIAEHVANQTIHKGAVVIMDPTNGNILASVSMPTFQPNIVADCLDNPDSPLLNRAVANYNCGSVFKIVSAAAAIEAGVPLSQTYTCTGSVTVEGVTFHCHDRLGHGTLDMTQAFAQSCNAYFIQLIQDVGAQRLYNMAVNMGFDRALMLAPDFKTARAVLPSLQELGSDAALANLSFGQGSLMATPMHIAQMVTTVVNNGMLLRPNLVAGTVDKDGSFTPSDATPAQYAFSPSTADKLRSMMIATVQKGATGEAANPPVGGGAGGKTGTAETGWKNPDGSSVVQSWFAGFYPAVNPKYVIVVLAEDSTSTGDKATTAFERICEGLNGLTYVTQ